MRMRQGTAQRTQMRVLCCSSLLSLLSGEGDLGEGDPRCPQSRLGVKLSARTAGLFLVIVRVTPFIVG